MYKNILEKIYVYAILLITLILVFSCNKKGEDIIGPPQIFIKMPETGYELEVGDSITLSPKITYNYNSIYTWYLNGEKIANKQSIKHKSVKLGKDVYSFVVQTPNGKDSIDIPVTTIVMINFAELKLEGNADVGLNLPQETPWFLTKGVIFPANPSTETQWFGYALCNRTGQENSSANVLSAFTSETAKNTFMIFSQPPSPFNGAVIFNDGRNHQIKSIAVCNSTLVYLTIKNGAEGIKRFGGESNNEPDWFLLTIEGYNLGGEITGKVDFYLADYRFENNKRDYIVNKFTPVDLSSLGMVNKLVLKLTSSVTGSNGEILTPRYVCIDNIKILN